MGVVGTTFVGILSPFQGPTLLGPIKIISGPTQNSNRGALVGDQVSVYSKVYISILVKDEYGDEEGYCAGTLADFGKLVTCTLSALSIFNLEDKVELEGDGIVTCSDRRVDKMELK
jgi:hypothetical protein